MSLAPGTRLGSYEIIAPIGAGGMGEVYRAKDTKLNRDVAIKVLPESFALDADRVARFTREAQVLASLNHPNIAAIYGIEESGNTRALVMELVEGEDLSAHIARGAMPLVEVLPIARQIAEALEAAHELGVVHRDLKPQNIKLRADGTVKVLDFGLAKAMTSGDGSSANSANSPTMTTPAMTAAGMIMGTAAYMSPEQARGRAVDRRADIWAFGCVLYEMLAGRPAFHCDTVTDTLSAILRDDPDWTPLAGLPPPVDRLLRRCLEKDPKQRLRDIGEARILLSDASSGAMKSAATPAANTPLAPAKTAVGRILAAAIVVAVMAAGTTWLAMRSGARPTSLEASIVKVTADSGLTYEPAVARGGSLLAYASDRGGDGLDIWVQPLPSGAPVQITHNPADDREPDFSPDGSRIVFRSDRDGGGAYEVPALGGAERLIAAKGRTPKFSPDGKWISYWTGGRAVKPTTWITDGRGGVPRAIGADLRFAGTLWCPDGKSVIGYGTNVKRTGSDDWYAVDIDSGQAVSLGAARILKDAGLSVESPAAWLDGEILFPQMLGERQSLWAMPMRGCRSVAGAPRALTTGTPEDSSPAVVSTPDGLRLFYAGAEERTNIFRLVAGSAADAPVIAPLTDDAAYDSWPSISSDGRTLAFGSERAGKVHPIVRDLAARTSVDVALSSNVDATGGTLRTSVISPDGRTLAVVLNDRKINLQPVAGGSARSIPVEVDIRRLWDWPRPAIVTFSDTTSDGRAEAFAVNIESGKMLKLLDSPLSKYLGHARLAPDGKWMSLMDWVSDDLGRVVVVPYDGMTTATTSQVISITDGQSVVEENVWAPDGATLYMVSEADGYRCIWSRRLDPRTKQPVGPLTAVAHFHRPRQQIVTTANTPQRLDMSPTGLVFAVTERHGNIWMATVKK